MNTQEANKQSIAEFVNELANRHNPNAWEEYCAEDFEHHFDLPGIPATRAGVKQLSQSILAAFPAISVQIDLLIAEDDWVVERATARAAHTGAYHNIAPTGREYTWQETHLYRLRDGKIVEHFPEVRLEKVLMQLTGKSAGFVAPPDALLSRVIGVAMGYLARLYQQTNSASLEVSELNRQVIRTYINQFKNEQKFTVFPKLFASQFTHHFDFPGRTNGLSSFVSVGQLFLSAFPDVTVTVQRVLTEGDFVVEHNRVRATHRGVFNGIQPTGRPVQWTEIHIYRLAAGKVVENWPAVNFERILSQLV